MITIPNTLLIALNHMCSGTEMKIILAMLICEPEDITTKNMLDITGITHSNNYFRARKKLLDIGYLITNQNGIFVNTDKILADYALLTK